MKAKQNLYLLHRKKMSSWVSPISSLSSLCPRFPNVQAMISSPISRLDEPVHRFQQPLAGYLLGRLLVYPEVPVMVCKLLWFIDLSVYSLLTAFLCLAEMIASPSAIHSLGECFLSVGYLYMKSGSIGTTKMRCA